MDNLLVAVVHEADIQERDDAPFVLTLLHNKYRSITKVYADGGCTGERLKHGIAQLQNLQLEIVKHQAKQKQFVILPKRWVFEKTFAWLGRCKRLAKAHRKFPQLALHRLNQKNVMTPRKKITTIQLLCQTLRAAKLSTISNSMRLQTTKARHHIQKTRSRMKASVARCLRTPLVPATEQDFKLKQSHRDQAARRASA